MYLLTTFILLFAAIIEKDIQVKCTLLIAAGMFAMADALLPMDNN